MTWAGALVLHFQSTPGPGFVVACRAQRRVGYCAGGASQFNTATNLWCGQYHSQLTPLLLVSVCMYHNPQTAASQTKKAGTGDACGALNSLMIPASAIGLRTQGATVHSAKSIPASGDFGEYCMVQGSITPAADGFPIYFQVNLPTMWNRKAADQGLAEAQDILGLEYETGKGVEQNEVTAVQWLRKAAEQGNADGQQDLALVLTKGKTVPHDPAEAYFWLVAASTTKKNVQAMETEVRAQITTEQAYAAEARASTWIPKKTN